MYYRILVGVLFFSWLCTGCQVHFTDPYAGQYDPNRNLRSEGFISAIYHVLGVGKPQGLVRADEYQRQLVAGIACNDSSQAKRTLKKVQMQLAESFPSGAVSLSDNGELLRVTFSGVDVYDSGHEHIKPIQYGRLHRLMSQLQSYGTLRVKVIGHADAVDSQAYNYQLSKRRAEHIARYATAYDVPSDIVQVQAQGELDPVASNKTLYGRAQNRRVTLEVCSI